MSHSAAVEPGAADGPVVVLASSSPRRLHLLRQIGVDPLIVTMDVDETPAPDESPAVMVERLALAKARAGWRHGVDSGHQAWSTDRPVGPLVVGADTTIDRDGVSLAKPADEAEARMMLRSLSGRAHEVYTGVALLLGSGCATDEPVVVTFVDRTTVTFVDLTDADIDWYIATGEPFGKAGAYTVQGVGSWMVKHLAGSYHNVVGLPLAALDDVTRSLGWPLRRLATRAEEVIA